MTTRSKRGRPPKVNSAIYEEQIGRLKIQLDTLVETMNGLKVTILDQAAVIRYLENKLEKK